MGGAPGICCGGARFPRWLLQGFAGMTFSGWVAVLAGWLTTEIGRQPYIVYGVITTAETASDVPAPYIALTFVGYRVVYTLLLISYMVVLTQLARKEAEGKGRDLPEPRRAEAGQAREHALDLPLIFLVLMGLAILAYVILDGFDLGVGILLPLATRPDQDMMVASIGPFWDANETWLVLGVGILLVAFPHAHGVVLSSLYLEVALMLIALILRGVAFEFRVKASGWHQSIWNRLFFVGSLGAAIAQGDDAGRRHHRLPGGRALRCVPQFLVGLGLAGGYALLGATWLVIKTENELHARALRWGNVRRSVDCGRGRSDQPGDALHARRRHGEMVRPGRVSCGCRPCRCSPPRHSPASWCRWSVCSVAASQREWLPFVLSVWVFVFAFIGLAYSLFPYLVVDRMTFREAAAAEAIAEVRIRRHVFRAADDRGLHRIRVPGVLGEGTFTHLR